VAVGTLELDQHASGAAPNGVHVNGVIELHSPRVGFTEIGMAVLQTANMICDIGPTERRVQIGMTFGASLIAHSGNIDSPAMLTVARAARERFFCIAVVSWAIVAGEASRVRDLGGELAGFPRVAGRAFFFEHGMGIAHPPAGINAIVAGKGAPGNPDQRKQRQQDAEPEFRALQRRRPLEIIQVDALGKFFGCACACHFFSRASSAAP
jgi:hypothetical protein